jgi:hypothetical protein
MNPWTWRRLDQWRSLSPGQQWLLLQCILLLPLVGGLLSTLGLASTLRYLGSRSGRMGVDRPQPGATEVEQARRLARLVSVAARHGIYKAGCLRQAVLTWWLLRRRGISSEIGIGSSVAEGVFEAHAWVMVGSEVVGDSPEVVGQYQMLPLSPALGYDLRDVAPWRR